MKTFLLKAVLLLMACSHQTLSQENLNLYFGLLHGHTWYSDGSGTPEEAYKMAKSEGLDFFAITPHNHIDAEGYGQFEYPNRKDGVLIATQPELYNSSSKVSFTRKWKNGKTEKHQNEKSVISAANDLSDDNFLALYGQEFSTGSGGNHINVFGIPEVITISNGRFDLLIEEVKKQKDLGIELVLQLNHPGVIEDLTTPKESEFQNDYGFDDYGRDFKKLLVNTDEHYNLIEVFSGPALDDGIYDDNYRYNDYRYEFNDYYFYLKQGFHLSPSVGQDNHYKTWGKATPARMGVYAKSLSQEEIFDAFKNHRTYASEDKNLVLEFNINGEFMGSKIQLNTDEDLIISGTITDPDANDQVKSVELFHGVVNPETGSNWTNIGYFDKRVGRTKNVNNGKFEFKEFIVSGDPEFYFVKVTQQDGQRIISAPIWINYQVDFFAASTSPTYYWTASRSSKVYHETNCKTIKLIKDSNLRSGQQPPPGRNLHECTIDSTSESH